jgi:aminoglycoside 6'-N-acetyltransferase
MLGQAMPARDYPVEELRGDRVVLRPVTDADVDAIAAILAEPEVERWWGEHDADRVRRELIEDEETELLAVELAGELVGILQIYEENEPAYRHASLDISLATRHHDRGLGREALRVAIDHLADERGHHRFTIDPSLANARAIRCYTAVGFKPVGVLRRYERAPDGSWRDGLLMDMLADERP